MLHSLKKITLVATLLFVGAAQAQAPSPVAQGTLLLYLDQLTQWQRDVSGIEPTVTNAREIVFRDSLRDNSSKVLQSGFVFIRSMAQSEPATETVDPESTRQKLVQQIKATQQKITTLPVGDAQRLEHARLELMRTILANLNAASNKSPNKLIYTIDSLSRSIPELNPDVKQPKQEVVTTVAAKRPVTSILGLSARAFEANRKQRELSEVIEKTTALKKQRMEPMNSPRSGLGEAVPVVEGEEAAKPIELTVDERVEAYKQIGANIVPLAESMRWMDTSKQTLREWREVLTQRGNEVLSQLAVRIGILAFTLAVALVASELVERAINRVPDAKRKRQLNTVRRVITGVAITIILIFNFISDFSSFATFAGFLTAGLAVALQSVLLSLVAHFLFYGRYGIRNGDRVHVAGVTGDIVQIGMVRFYLKELAENDKGELEQTGKTVAFPNSIVFQNVAFYKYA